MILDARNACDCSRHHHAHHGNARHETMESARLIAGNPGPYRVTKGRPCPVCGREKWCCFDPLSGICLCPRQADGALQDHSFRPIRLGELGFLHVHGAASIYAGGSPARPTRASRAKSDAANDPARLTRIQGLYRMRPGDHLDAAAEELALPAASLEAFGAGRFNHYFPDAGKNCPTWTWPEWSATGDIVGLGHRRQVTGAKRFQGKRGIILTEAHAADREKLRADIVARGRVILPEGFTDTVAASAMGEVAIGRPSVSGGVVAIADLLNSLALPETVEVVLLGENDLAADGRWPGRDWAMEGARKLARLLGYRFHIKVVMPPDGVKDLRAGWKAGYRTWQAYEKAATILETSVTSAIDCGLVADWSTCPDSSVLKPNTVPRKRDKWTLPQRIRTLFASNPWSCQKVRGVAGRETATFSPALIAAGCGTWICPVCGEYRRLRAYDRFGFHIFHHDGELYCDTVADFDWPAVLKTMRRRAKKLNVRLRYLSIRDNANNLTVIASVPILDVARPIEFSEALEVLEAPSSTWRRIADQSRLAGNGACYRKSTRLSESPAAVRRPHSARRRKVGAPLQQVTAGGLSRPERVYFWTKTSNLTKRRKSTTGLKPGYATTRATPKPILSTSRPPNSGNELRRPLTCRQNPWGRQRFRLTFVRMSGSKRPKHMMDSSTGNAATVKRGCPAESRRSN